MINKYWNLEEYNFGQLADSDVPVTPYSAATVEDPIKINS